MKEKAIIIAAGESSRFWPLNQRHKSFISLLGHSLLYWTVRGLIENGIADFVVVCKNTKYAKNALENLKAQFEFVEQKEALGTGNALYQAKKHVTGPFYLIWPNQIQARQFAGRMEEEKEKGAKAVLVGAPTNRPQEHGVVRFEGEKPAEIVEKPPLGKEPSSIKMVGAYYFGQDFFDYYGNISRHYDTDLVEAVNKYIKDKKTSLIQLQEPSPSLKYPWELFEFLDILFSSKNFVPKIAKSASIGKGVVIKGDVFIGENSIIKENTIIEGPCFIGDDCEIGYSNVLRGPVNLESGVKTGAFCEIKHSVVQRDTHFHSGYIGDSLIGENCRFGAGFITANRRIDREAIRAMVRGDKTDTQLTYLGAIVGGNTRFGIHTGTMPGVMAGSNCLIGPGVYLFENVADETSIMGKFSYEKK